MSDASAERNAGYWNIGYACGLQEWRIVGKYIFKGDNLQSLMSDDVMKRMLGTVFLRL